MPTIDGSPWVAGATSIGLGTWLERENALACGCVVSRERGGATTRFFFFFFLSPTSSSISSLHLSISIPSPVVSMLGGAAAAALVLSKAAANLVVSLKEMRGEWTGAC
jgi:hypothetical protein